MDAANELMSYDNELVSEVRQASGLKLDAVAAETSISTSSINRYELGVAPVPMAYGKRLLAMTGDQRLLQYFCPGASLPARAEHQMCDPQELIAEELVAAERLVDALKNAQRIFADGQVNARDDHAIAALLADHVAIRRITEHADYVIGAMREQSDLQAATG